LAQRNFWVRDAKNSQAELDFVIQTEQQLIPVEVKSGHNSKMKSMHLFMEQSRNNFAIRFWNSPMQKDEVELPSGKKYTLLSLPFYYAEIIKNILFNR
jgi:predicted AAA+ superfamily ATPase